MNGSGVKCWRVLAMLCVVWVAAPATACHWAMPGIGPLHVVVPITLKIAAFSYAPPSPIRVGDSLTFTAQIPQGELSDVHASLSLPGGAEMFTLLHDDGVAPDALAGDRIFTGAARWLASYGAGTAAVRVSASGILQGEMAAGTKDAAPLTVLP